MQNARRVLQALTLHLENGGASYDQNAAVPADSQPLPGRSRLRVATLPDPEAVPEIFLRCLGSFALEVRGLPLRVRLSGKPAALLKFLAARGRVPATRDQIIEALWPDCDGDAAVRRLRVALHELRRALLAAVNPDTVIKYRRGCLVLGSAGRLGLDIELFETEWRRGVQLERQARIPEAMQAYAAAEAFYGGDFLEEDPYEEWTLLRREFLRDAHLDMLGKLAANAFAHHGYSECNALCQRLLESDPCQEEAYRLLIRSHLASGQPARAQRWYEICGQVLKRELDLEPSQGTSALVEHIARRHARAG
jgi:DNA-binding SARP family transcriptional activator